MTATATEGRRRSGGQPRRARQTAATREAALQRELTMERNNLELLEMRLRDETRNVPTTEGVADLERQILNDPGWRLFSVLQEQEFSADGMVQLRAVCRLMGIANPLIKRALELRMVWVHGQGYEIRARATGRAPDKGRRQEQDVNAVVDRFVRDKANQRALFGQQAAGEMERALGTDGEVFIALFTRPASGWVQARTFGADEITEVITNPDDKSEPWYYRRVWQRQSYNDQGHLQYEQQELLYPDVDYRPRRRPARFGGVQIEWSAPVIQVAVNRPLNWLRGIPDAYAAINWARAYKDFLEQWATLMKSLAKFAWRLTTQGKNRAQAKAALAAAGTSRMSAGGETQDVGGTAITPMDATLEAIPKSGATIDSESGRPLAMMVAAGMGIPVTMLLADPGQTGARATAETLDWPTELTMRDRRELWGTVRLRMCEYVITESVRATGGALKGKITRDEATDREVVELAGDTDDTVEIIWPDLDDVEAKEIIDGIVAANGPGVLPPEFVLRQLLTALGVRDVDSIVQAMEDDDGNFLWPKTAATAGQEAAALAAGGGDPATAGGSGLMGPDGNPVGGPPGPLGPDGQPLVPGQAGPPGAEAIVPTEGVEGRMADADFGLFGNGLTAADDQPPAPAGAKPAAGTYDASFFAITPGDGVDDEDLDDDVDDTAVTGEPISEAAAARMADADFGLRGATGATEDPEPAQAGDKPETGTYDPEFFKL